MDRIAALADILPPAPPPPLPPAPWWQGPTAWLLAAFALMMLAWVLLWLRRSRRWRALHAAARQAARADCTPQQAATLLAAQLHSVLPEADWQQTLRGPFDTLRFAPTGGNQTVAQAGQLLRGVARAVEQASRRAARSAWRGRAQAHAAFVRSLCAAKLERT